MCGTAVISFKMAALAKAVRISKAVNNVSKLFTNMKISSNTFNISASLPRLRINSYPCAFLHTTQKRNDLMEFFDDEQNWGEQEVKVGRSWKKDELRLKSNEDLHKLWFVLLKEKNMLLTMEHACKNRYELFPNPERTYKVDESMKNLETVVRERNQAYHLLETGTHGERPGSMVVNQLGLRSYYRMTEHLIPRFMNTSHRKKYIFGYKGRAVKNFLKLYREKIWDAKRKAKNRDRNHVMHLLKRFPEMDMEAVKHHYPDVDIEKCKQHKKARGHFVPK